MGHARFSIASLMAAVLFAATVVAALSHPSEWWATTLYTIALVLLCWATVAALLLGRRRPFWTGFAVFGWVHLVVNFGLFGLIPIPGLRFFPPPPPTLYEKIMNGLESRMLSWPTSIQPTPTPATTPVPAGTAIIIVRDNQTPFHQAGRALLTLLIAWFGGMLAQVARGARRPARPSSPDGPSPSQSASSDS